MCAELNAGLHIYVRGEGRKKNGRVSVYLLWKIADTVNVGAQTDI